MDGHRYVQKSRFQKVNDVIMEKGVVALFERTVSYAQYRIFYYLSPLIISIKGKKTFIYQGNRYNYFYHRHNLTWRNERAVEVPIALSLAESFRGRRILEVGNVLSHYAQAEWEIIDKFEKEQGVLNADVVDFVRPETYDLILSISTIEHVGFDDDPKDPQKIQLALNVLKENLREGGVLFVSCPLGYNPLLDEQIAGNVLGFTEQSFLVRTAHTTWKEAGMDAALSKKFGQPYPSANAVFIGIYRR